MESIREFISSKEVLEYADAIHPLIALFIIELVVELLIENAALIVTGIIIPATIIITMGVIKKQHKRSELFLYIALLWSAVAFFILVLLYLLLIETIPMKHPMRLLGAGTFGLLTIGVLFVKITIPRLSSWGKRRLYIRSSLSLVSGGAIGAYAYAFGEHVPGELVVGAIAIIYVYSEVEFIGNIMRYYYVKRYGLESCIRIKPENLL